MASSETSPSTSTASSSSIPAASLEIHTPIALNPLCNDYDMKTFWGRLKYFALQSSPEHMFTTDANVADAREILGNSTPVETKSVIENLHGDKPRTAEEFGAVKQLEREWAARFLLCGSTHPASNEIIPTPVRMGSWVAMGAVPITGLMITAMSGPTNLIRIAGLQWWNQSINASINYNNGSAVATGDEATKVFLEGYVGACAAAVGIGMGAARACAKMPFLRPIAAYAPYPAVALANVFNTYLVRRHETVSGVAVHVGGAQGETIGMSKAAAWQGILDTCVSRVIIPAGNFLVVPFLYNQLVTRSPKYAMQLMMRPSLGVAVQMGLTLGVYYAMLPVALAIYDQEGEISVKDLEPEIAEAARARGQTSLFYHKGI